MHKIVIPFVFVFLLAAALTVNTVLPVAADQSAKPQQHGGVEGPFKDL